MMKESVKCASNCVAKQISANIAACDVYLDVESE